MPKKRERDNASGLVAALLLRNPVLIELVGICPVAAAAVSLKSAIVLAVVYWLVLIFTQSFASLFLRRVPRWIRVALYLILGLAVVLPACALLDKRWPQLRISVGLYLPLLAVNSLTALRCEKEGVRRDFSYGLIDSLVVGFGYAVVLIGVGLLRDLFGQGVFLGRDVPYIIPSRALLMPFGGFLVLGFLAALLKVLTMKFYPGYAKRMSVSIIPTPVTMKLQDKKEPELNRESEGPSSEENELPEKEELSPVESESDSGTSTSPSDNSDSEFLNGRSFREEYIINFGDDL